MSTFVTIIHIVQTNLNTNQTSNIGATFCATLSMLILSGVVSLLVVPGIILCHFTYGRLYCGTSLTLRVFHTFTTSDPSMTLKLFGNFLQY